jgi:hypothetical protein
VSGYVEGPQHGCSKGNVALTRTREYGVMDLGATFGAGGRRRLGRLRDFRAAFEQPREAIGIDRLDQVVIEAVL